MEVANDLALIITVALVIVAVGWLEVRYLRKRGKDRADAGVIRDEAYSAVATTKAVASSLSANGRDVLEAETFLYRAESAYDRGNYPACKELADQARAALLRSRSKDLVDLPKPSVPAGEEALPTEVPAHGAKKLPPNYLESKFIMETVEGMARAAGEEAGARAEPHRREARTAFEKEDYTAALCSAMRAKRALEGTPATERRTVPGAEVITLPEKGKGAECTRCGALVGPGDGFCPLCGNERGPRSCPSCSREAAEDDVFCRKCGARIGT